MECLLLLFGAQVVVLHFAEIEKLKLNTTIIMCFVLCACATWSVTVREEHRLRMIGNRVLRKVFRHKRAEVTGHWTKLHNAGLHDVYCLPGMVWAVKSRMMKQVKLSLYRPVQAVRAAGG
jgi:hypothetical protein